MTAGIVPQRPTELLVNTETARQIALALAAQQAKPDPTVETPLDRALTAAIRLLESSRTWTLRGESLHVQSERHDWLFYDCTLTSCDCLAGEHGRFCKHIALLMILLAYEPIAAALTIYASRPDAQPKPTPQRQRTARVAPHVAAALAQPRPQQSYDEVLRLADELYA